MKKKKIINGRGPFAPEGTLYLFAETIVSEEEYRSLPGEEEILDAKDAYLAPGLLDIHFHGCVGSDCCDGSVDALHQMAAFELREGVTSITPATMTVSEEDLLRICDAAKQMKEDPRIEEADFMGLYMEGPFISPAKKGAQNEAHIRLPDFSLYEKLQERSNNLFLSVVVAPEQPGAMEFIERCKDRVHVSLAHMTADYDTAAVAFEKGARGLTHLYNAMPGLSHRAPGPIAAGADREDVYAELICDGVHVHPSMVRAAFKLFGKYRILFISDSMRACGLQDGTYDLGGQMVTVTGKEARLSDGTIAGSVTNLMNCVRTAVKEMGIPLEDALRCASLNPAKALGLEGQIGSLLPGRLANILLLDEDLSLKGILHRGEWVK